MGETKIVVGLGNPGEEYKDTRHNCGFMAIDELSSRLNIEVRKKKFNAKYGMGEYAGKKLILLKPQQYMNNSGQSVATAAGFYKIDVSDLLVISDDMALEPGRIRIRAKGSAGGHNGLADIINKLGTDAFARLRIGIGQSERGDAVDFVLDRPPKEETILLQASIERAKDAVFCWIEYGIETAMNRFND